MRSIFFEVYNIFKMFRQGKSTPTRIFSLLFIEQLRFETRVNYCIAVVRGTCNVQINLETPGQSSSSSARFSSVFRVSAWFHFQHPKLNINTLLCTKRYCDCIILFTRHSQEHSWEPNVKNSFFKFSMILTSGDW